MTPHSSTAPFGRTTASRSDLLEGHFGTRRPPTSLSASLRGLLLNTALLAVSRGMHAEASAIKQVLIGLGIDRKQLGMAMALIRLQHGEHDDYTTDCQREAHNQRAEQLHAGVDGPFRGAGAGGGAFRLV